MDQNIIKLYSMVAELTERVASLELACATMGGPHIMPVTTSTSGSASFEVVAPMVEAVAVQPPLPEPEPEPDADDAPEEAAPDADAPVPTEKDEPEEEAATPPTTSRASGRRGS